MKNYKIVCSIIVLCAVLFITVGFSAFNKELFVDDVTGFFEVYKDVRLTDAKFERSTTGVVANYTEHDIYNFYSQVKLPNADSSVTYRINITNYGNFEQVLMDIVGLPENLEYTLDNYTFYDKICNDNWECNLGVTKELLVTIKHKSDIEITYPDNTLYNLKLEFKFGFLDPNYVYDKTHNKNYLKIYGAVWDKSTQSMFMDGIDDYMYTTKPINYGGSSSFTIEFVAKINPSKKTNVMMLFESSENSTTNNQSYYIDTNEQGFGDKSDDLVLAMRYYTPQKGTYRNHKGADQIIDYNRFVRYTMTFNSKNGYDNYIRMYKDGEQKSVSMINQQLSANLDPADGVSYEILQNYPLYIGSRGGTTLFSEFYLKELKVYNRELTSEEVLENYKGNVVKDGLLVFYDFK